MKALDRRLAVLEAALPSEVPGRVDLDRLSTADLERLEAIVIARDGGTPIEDMSDDDLRFLASLRVVAE